MPEALVWKVDFPAELYKWLRDRPRAKTRVRRCVERGMRDRATLGVLPFARHIVSQLSGHPMHPSSRTPEGEDNRCPVCGHDVCIEPSSPPGDAPCPHCGHLLWFTSAHDLYAFDFIRAPTVVRDMKAKTKPDAIRMLTAKISDAGHLPPDRVDDVVAALLRREELGSTAIGRGVAVPHARHAAVSRVVGAVGYAAEGIDFDSLDRSPVTRVFLLLAPLDDPQGALYKALERVSRFLRDTA
jgi:mannitol/fructose-specific phosphotransferase system IIA component (Ntr-type)